jgi:hypothetical protein
MAPLKEPCDACSSRLCRLAYKGRQGGLAALSMVCGTPGEVAGSCVSLRGPGKSSNNFFSCGQASVLAYRMSQ